MIKKRLVSLMAESKRYIAWNVFWQWAALAASMVIMLSAGRLLEDAFTGRLRAGTAAVLAAGILAAVLVRALCSRKAAMASYLAGSDVKKKLRLRLYEKLQSLGASYHEKVPTAEAVQVAVEGVEQLEIYFGKYLPQLFYSLLAPVTLFAVLSFVSLRASLVLLVCVPLIPATIMAVQKLAKRLLAKYWGIYTELGDSFLENLQGLTTLKIYQADEQKAREMDEEAEHFRKITMKVLMMQLNSIIVMDVVAYGGAAAGIIVVLSEYMAGRVSLAGTISMILLSSEFFIPMRLLGSFFHIAMNGMAASDKLFVILDMEEGEKGKQSLPEGPLGLFMEQVEFSYEPLRPVLRGISLQVPERGMVSLVGVSGCGKSTIAGLLSGSNKGYKGSIRIGGVELSQVSEECLLRRVTLVSHNSYLFKGTVEENLRMAAWDAPEEALLTALKEVNLYEFVMAQGGLSMKLEERGSNLSGGQCQRLALARALLHDSPVYVFDEAASNIDVESEDQIMQVIRRLAADHAVVFISHRLANVVQSEQIYVMDGGVIREQGRHEELLALGGAYAGLYFKQQALEAYGKPREDGETCEGSRDGGKKQEKPRDGGENARRPQNRGTGRKNQEKGGRCYA